MKEKNNYRPLPYYLTVKRSPIDKLGLFAVNDIKINKNIGVTHVHRWENIVRTPLGGFINHSDDPNCKLIREEKSAESELVTIKNIKAGEELTLKYKMYKIGEE